MALENVLDLGGGGQVIGRCLIETSVGIWIQSCAVFAEFASDKNFGKFDDGLILKSVTAMLDSMTRSVGKIESRYKTPKGKNFEEEKC